MNTGGIYGGSPRQTEAADFAQAMAGGAGAVDVLVKNSAFPTTVAAVAPAILTAPSSAVVAVFAVNPVRTGRFFFNFSLVYTDSLADTVFGSVNIYTGVTSVTGGTNVGTAPAPVFTWESSAITVTGGSSVGNPSNYEATFATGNLTQTMAMDGTFGIGVPFWLILFVSATHALSPMSLNAACGEF